MPDFESLRINTRPGDNTGVGVTAANLDVNGLQAVAPTYHKQDSNVLHDKMLLCYDVTSTVVSNYIFFCNDGTWQVHSATYMSQVAGTGGACTLDLRVCSAGVAPSGGTTQLDAVFDLTTAAQAIDRSVIISSPTEIGPGGSLAVVLTGTPTSVVGLLQVQLKRIR